MTDKEKLEKIKSLADKMSNTASNITTDASLLKKAIDEYHQFIINEYHKEEQTIKELQEKPISSIWHNASEKSNEPEDVVIINPSDNTGEVLTKCVDVYQGRIWAYTSVLLNLDNPCKIGKNLQEEPVNEDLEKAANEWDAKASFTPFYMALDDNGNPSEVKRDYTTHAESFKAGAKWQKQKDSMFISEDLEKASYLFACKCHPLKTECSTSSPNREVIEAFKTGAKWQKEKDDEEKVLTYKHGFEDCKEQMRAKAIDAQCFGFQGAALFSFRLPADNYLVGSEVKVIVIKED